MGLGQQSSALAILIANKDSRVKKYHDVKYCIFADTYAEYPETYIFKAFLQHYIEKRGMYLVTVSAGDMIQDFIDTNFCPSRIIRKSCTDKYKIRPIRRFLKKHGFRKAVQLFGMTIEEKRRINESDVKYLKNEYPLFDLKLTRRDCIKIIKENNLPVPRKSGCYCCPCMKRTELKIIKRDYPELAKRLIELENSSGYTILENSSVSKIKIFGNLKKMLT